MPFRIPEREDLPERLGVALEAIYAAFAHGWAEAFSDDPRGRNLADEAIWLGRVIVSLIPNQAEAMGLLALMLYAHARRDARRDALGRYVPLSEQAVERWDAERRSRKPRGCSRPPAPSVRRDASSSRRRSSRPTPPDG